MDSESQVAALPGYCGASEVLSVVVFHRGSHSQLAQIHALLRRKLEVPDDCGRLSAPAFVASMASSCNDHMDGGSPGTGSGESDAVIESHAVVAEEGGGCPRLLASAHLEAERESGRKVVARKAGIRRHVPDPAVRPEAARCLRSGRASRRSRGGRSVGGHARTPPTPGRGPPGGSVRLRRRRDRRSHREAVRRAGRPRRTRRRAPCRERAQASRVRCPRRSPGGRATPDARCGGRYRRQRRERPRQGGCRGSHARSAVRYRGADSQACRRTVPIGRSPRRS
jgi:hypothetical protein